MRSHVAALLAVLPLIATPVAAQQPGPTPQAGVNQNVQTDADKGIKTRNSGESGYVANQDKPGTASHAPGEANTVGAARDSNSSNMNSSQADYNASLKDGSAPKK